MPDFTFHIKQYPGIVVLATDSIKESLKKSKQSHKMQDGDENTKGG